MIHKLDGIVKQVWDPDDSAAGWSLETVRSSRWWYVLVEIGRLHGYFSKDSKAHIQVKLHHAEAAKEIMRRTGIVVSTQVECCLGGAIVASTFVHQYITCKKSGMLGEWSANAQ